MITYTLKVIEIKKETHDTVTLLFKQPGLKKIKYIAGQYLTLIFRINGRRYLRPYSFSSAPSVDSTLDVTIKRVQNGIVSNHIHDVIKVGDSIEVMPPMGDFVFTNQLSCSEVFLWGIGSGITPLISLAKQILVEFPIVNVNLIYGNRSSESIIFQGLIDSLLLKYPERLKVWHFLTQLSITEMPPYLIQGRITKSTVYNVMKEVDASQSVHYICGPLGLKESVKGALTHLNVKDEFITSEDFELIKDPSDFENIHTQKINLKFKDQQYNLEVIKGKSILESALDAGIELPYSCQTGSCSTCLAKVKTGCLIMIGLKNKREDLLKDEYLLCCSHPVTNNVSIEV